MLEIIFLDLDSYQSTPDAQARAVRHSLTGPALREMRKAAGLTQKALALRVGCTRARISQAEQGIAPPSVRLAYKLLAVLAPAQAATGS